MVASSTACQSLCQANSTCAIWTWSKSSKECYFRLDGEWGAKPTLPKPSTATSGCHAPTVHGCGINPADPPDTLSSNCTKHCAAAGFPIANKCWSEEYQSMVVHLDISTCLASGTCAGITIWQLFDTLDQRQEPATRWGRPGGLNNKGMLSRERVPKLSYATATALYGGEL